MVEYQIVALKVSGSNPDIYPVLIKQHWNLDLSNKFKKNIFYKLFFLLRNYKTNFLYLIKLKNLVVLTSTFKKNSFKYNFKSLDTNVINKIKLNFFKKYPKQHYFKNLFKSYIYLNTWSEKFKLSVHPTLSQYYYYNSHFNTGLLNLKKLNNVWKNLLNFILNIFFFQLNFVTFSNSYFKYETLLLNIQLISLIKYLYKYTSSFVFLLNNKNRTILNLYFDFLKKSKCNILFIIDTYYNKNVIYLSNKFNLISIGPVPINNNLYILDIALPISSNSIFSNLFFLRLILKLKTLNLKLLWNSYKL